MEGGDYGRLRHILTLDFIDVRSPQERFLVASEAAKGCAEALREVLPEARELLEELLELKELKELQRQKDSRCGGKHKMWILKFFPCGFHRNCQQIVFFFGLVLIFVWCLDGVFWWF